MAILTRPIFHSQERIDLEDLVQLQSGLRTDSKLWVRQLYTDKNFIVKGFTATGLGTDAITVDLLDATLMFSGRRDLNGVATITVDNPLVAMNTVTISNSDGVNFTLTAVDSGAGTNEFDIGTTAALQATNLAAAISSLADLTASADGTVITVTATRTGFVNITTDNTSAFNNTGSIIGTFDYTVTSISSPADLSYFILQSGATGVSTTLTSTITAAQRATTGTAAKTLYIYGTLTTTQGTPITKAFWDPSANSGSGAEFNQRVNTAQDTTMVLNIQESELISTGTDAEATTFFENVAICEIDVDTSGIILAIRDTRPLLFEADDQRPWNRTTPYATLTVAQTVTNVSPTSATPNALEFANGEQISIIGLTNTNVLATARIVGGDFTATLEVDKYDLGVSPARASLAIGATSGAVRIIDGVSSNFFRDDKSLGDFRNTISALATEIRNVKGTERWYDDPAASVKDILRFINSTVIGIDPAARYAWTAADNSDGTLRISRDPLSSEVTLTVAAANGLVANQTLVFTNTTPANNRTLTAVTATPGTNQFLIGVDAEATASHLSSAINGLTDFQATFAQSGSDYVITIGSNDSTFTDVTSNLTDVAVASSPFVYSNVGNLANIKFYGVDADFFITTQNLIIAENEVLFVTLPDLSADSVTSQTFDQTQFRYSASGPGTGQGGSALWNSTNRALFEDATDRFKTVPVNDFVCTDRTYWIAYRDSTETIFVRDIGELGNNEAANIGHGISNSTLSYIGAPDENDSTPDYPAVDTINAFPPTDTEGAYLTNTAVTFNDFNRTLVAQSENLTSAINDLNNHLTSIKDTQYQNKGMKLINGGFWTWEDTLNNDELTLSVDANIQIPGLVDNLNTIAAATFNIPDGSLLQVNVNRQDVRASKTTTINIVPTVVTLDAFVPTRDKLVLARRIGDYIFIGLEGQMRLGSGESAPLDSALQFFGLNAQSELPRQLNTHIGTSASTIDIGDSDVMFKAGGQGTAGDISDDFITLTIPISGGILYWEGASFLFNIAGGLTGRIFNEGTTNNWRTRTTTDTSFTTVALGDDEEVYYAISIDGDNVISATDAEIVSGVIPARDAVTNLTNIGRYKGEFNIVPGSSAATNTAVAPDFGGSLPIAWIKVSRAAGSTVISTFDAETLTVVGAAGGGGGSGTGNANQDLNGYLNRLNLSTFEYFTPIIPAVSLTENINATNTNAAVTTSGATLPADAVLESSNLLDNEFLGDSITPDFLEIDSFWSANESDPSLLLIDPNAKYSVSFSAADTLSTQFTPFTEALSVPVVGFVNSSTVQVGQNLSGVVVNNLIFAANHGLSNGHKINLSTLGTLNPTDPDAGTLSTATQFYVRVNDEDSFFLYNTVFNADNLSVTTGIVTILGTAVGGSIFNRDAGIIDRVGVTTAMSGSFDLNNRTLIGSSYSVGTSGSVRIRVVGDTDADIRSQANNAIMTSIAMFYDYISGVAGVNPNSVSDLNSIIRNNHLVGPGAATYGVAGRGVTLLNNAATPVNAEIALDANNNITIDGTAPITTNGATDGQLLVANASGIFSPTTFSSGTTPQERELTNPTAGAAALARNWICPTNVNEIYLTLAGGGQGGQDVGNGGQGGAAGSIFSEKIEVTPGQTYTISVGAGGGTSGGPTRNGGGNTTFIGSATALINGGTSATVTAFSPVSTTGSGTATAGAIPTIIQTKRFNTPTTFTLTHSFDRFNNTGNAGGVGGANLLAQGGTQSQGGAGGAGYLDGDNSIGGTNAGQAGGAGGIRIQFLGTTGEGLITT